MANSLPPSRRYLYFGLEQAIRMHDWVLEQSGGLPGAPRAQLLESPLHHIRNDLYYPEFEDKLSHLIHSVVKLHAFADGNKRTALALAAYFLEINSFEFVVERFVQEMENIVVWVAAGDIDKPLLRNIIASLLYEDDFAEALKLAIYNATER